MFDTLIIWDAYDCERILNAMYKGRRPPHVHTLNCSCGASADLRQDPGAWTHWMILPHPCCPACQAIKRAEQLEQEPVLARERYLGLVGRLETRKVG